MKRWLLFIGLYILPMLAFAQQPDSAMHLSAEKVLKKETALRTNWLHHKGDDSTMALPNYDDSQWERVRIGKYAESYKDDFSEEIKQYKGIHWFRLHLYADSSLQHLPLTLRIEPKGAAEIYINGRLAKKLGRVDTKERTIYYEGDHNTHIFNFDSVGRNTIAIRYADYKNDIITEYKDDDIHAFELFVGEANFNITNRSALKNLRDVFLSLFAGIFGMLAGMHLLFWLYRRRDWSNLFAAILFIAVSLIINVVKNLTSASIPNYERSECYILILTVIAFAGLHSFLQVIFGQLNKRYYITMSIVGLGVLLTLFRVPYINSLMLILIAYLLIYSAFLMRKAIKEKQKSSRVLGIPIIFLAITIAVGYIGFQIVERTNTILDTTAGLSAIQLVVMFLVIAVIFIGTISVLSIPISITTFLAKRFANVSNELSDKLIEVQALSEKTLAQEQEKKRILENQKQQLEIEVAERTKEIVEEKKKSDDLLLNILPSEVADELKENGTTKAKHFDHVTVIFTDFVDFTKTGSRLSPEELVNELDTCFKAFDEICAKYHIEKIKTIGDAYMAVCGLPTAVADHAINTVQAALEIKAFIADRRKHSPDTSFRIRIGIHSGDVVAGIVGIKKFAYDIWGDTVNTAARMESYSEPDQINISEHTYELVKDQFNCTSRGNIEVKGKGAIAMYFVKEQKS
ncbi:MAG: adenylate/guanylate cyclase domain-containing protein [Flavipsychrobacter sp.]